MNEGNKSIDPIHAGGSSRAEFGEVKTNRVQDAMLAADVAEKKGVGPVLDMDKFAAELESEFGVTIEPDSVDIDGNPIDKYAKRSRTEIALDVALKVLGGDNYSDKHTQLIATMLRRLSEIHDQKAVELRDEKVRTRDQLEADINKLQANYEADLAELQKQGKEKLESIESQLGEVITRQDGVQAHLNRLVNGAGIQPLTKAAEPSPETEERFEDETETEPAPVKETPLETKVRELNEKTAHLRDTTDDVADAATRIAKSEDQRVAGSETKETADGKETELETV